MAVAPLHAHAKRVADVEQHAARAADVLLGLAAAASGAIQGHNVVAALRRGAPLQAYVPCLAPRDVPGVADEPVVAALWIRAVPDQLHHVVDGDVTPIGAAVEHSTLVVGPSSCLHIDSQGAHIGQGVHHRVVIVRRELLVTGDGDEAGGRRGIPVARAGAAGVRRVGHDPLRGQPVELHVVVGHLWDGALATSCAAARERVGRAVHELLGRQDRQQPRGQSRMALHRLRGGKGPAGAAGALVLHAAHDALCAPIDRSRQLRRPA
mmetsp:Transcript_98121/g.302537  ORF Transcript_98121/g.302537 Transcript_98121/m.302537 type:complete len:265 (-) Transcript_98121:401-1195(-)